MLPAVRLWRRNLQLRVVAGTLLMSIGVVLLLGFVVIGQVRNGLLDAKVKASQSQATGGFAVAKQTLSREVRALGYRKLSARPRHHAQAEGAVDLFKTASLPAWRRSRARRASLPVP